MTDVLLPEDSSMEESPSVPSQSLPPNSLWSRVEHILLWEDPLASGVSFACGMLFVLLIQLGGYSLLTLLSYLGLLQLIVCFIYINGTRAYFNMKGQGQPHDTFDDTEYLSYESFQSYAQQIHHLINTVLQRATDIIHCRDNITTLKVAFGLFVLSIVGRVLDGLTIFGIAYFLAFSLPKIYQLNRDKIDFQIDQLNAKLLTLSSKVTDKLPKATKEQKAE